MDKTTKTQFDKTATADSKPAQLAKLIYRGITRYIRAKNAENEGKNYGKTLDFGRERRVNGERKH